MKKNKTELINHVIMNTLFKNIGATHFHDKIQFKNNGFARIFLASIILLSFQKVSSQNDNSITNNVEQLGKPTTAIAKGANQSANIKIYVVDASDKPFSGVLVESVSNPSISSVTDSEGIASLDMLPTGLVRVFHNDMEKIISIKGINSTIQLKNSDKKVNVGYGIMKSVDEISTSIDVVYSDKLEKSSLLNPMESLYGKFKGLMVLQNGGEPWNRNPDLFLRGKGTTGNNRILVLVDGFERDLASLSLQDIENVSVLKDGTDVSKYGVRGANGVILVTTKRGESNSFHVGASFDKGWNIPFRRPKFLDSYGYATAVNQASALDGGLPVYSAQDLQDYKNGTSPLSHPNVDWWDETMRDYGFTNNLNTSFWGGGKSIKYFVSLNYQNERGLIDNTNLDSRYDSKLKYDRLNFRMNLDIEITKSTKFIVDASGFIGGQNEPFARTSSIINAIYSVPSAIFPVRTASGEWGGTQFYNNNPVALASSTGNSKPNYRTLYANGKIVQDLGSWVKGLSAEVAVAYDNYASFFENNFRTFLYQNTPFTRDPNTGVITFGTPQTFGTDTDLTNFQSFGDQIRHATGIGKINYETKWNNSKVNASVLYQEDKRVNDGQFNTFLRQNFMSAASYSFKNRYFIDGVLSYSGTSLLPKDGRFGLFPAVSAGWIVNRENFLKGNKDINYLKIRGSWSKSGNDLIPSNNLDRQFFNNGGTYNFGLGNTGNTGIREGRIATTGLTFESSEKVNVGVNMELFGKLSVNIDAFRDRRTDIIITTAGAVPSLLGITAPFENAGIVDNRGIESSFMWKKQVDKLKYFVGGNLTCAKNKILDDNEEFRPYDYLKQTGNSIGQQYGLQSIGFFENQADIDNSPLQIYNIVRPGDIKYKDQNSDGVIDNLDTVKIGSSADNPEFYYALNFGFETEGGFGLDILFQGIANKTLYLNTKSIFVPLVGQNNISSFSEGSWTPETAQTASLPRLTLLSNDNNYRKNDIWLRSGNYLKMRHFEFYYNIPSSFAKKISINKAKLYARGMNILSFDNLNIVDPEAIGITYPTLASYHLGINIEF